MQTKSEELFEVFLRTHDMAFEKIKEEATPRPDYLVFIGDQKIIFELKELTEDENFGVVTDPAFPHVKTNSGKIGSHVRRKIECSKKQVQYGARQGIPSALLLYNNLDQVFQRFGTDDLDFISAMYGEPTVLINQETKKVSELYHGKNQSLQKDKNTSFSAVGRLCDRGGPITVTLFENVYSAVKMPFDLLPSCFGTKRVHMDGEPLCRATVS